MAEFTPARLQAVNDVPRGDSWRYEPKFDGYRGLLVNGASGIGSVWSRNNKDLGRFFPELLDLASRLPRATVLDGEIVMPTPTGVSFITLQRRLTAARGDSSVAFIAFDILRCGDDLRGQTLSIRRRRLERIIDKAAESSLQLVTQTKDRDIALAWLDESLTITGIEGIVSKLDESYPKPESRRWKKVRRLSTAEFVVLGFIPEANDSMRLVLGRLDVDQGVVGTTYPLRGSDLRPLERFIPEAVPAGHRISAPFDDGRHHWFELPKSAAVIAEVVITTLDSGVLRQPARFARWRLTGETQTAGAESD